MMDNRRKTAIICGIVFLAMFVLAYAFSPLYSLFCKVTGFDGTTQVAESAPHRILDRKVQITFTSTTAKDLMWEFKPLQKTMTVRIGEVGLAYFKAKNLSDKPITGMALYNVTPNKAGGFFNKIHCFCFDLQTLQAGEEREMPVTFFIDPKMADEPLMDDVTQISLNYTFNKN